MMVLFALFKFKAFPASSWVFPRSLTLALENLLFYSVYNCLTNSMRLMGPRKPQTGYHRRSPFHRTFVPLCSHRPNISSFVLLKVEEQLSWITATLFGTQCNVYQWIKAQHWFMVTQWRARPSTRLSDCLDSDSEIGKKGRRAKKSRTMGIIGLTKPPGDLWMDPIFAFIWHDGPSLSSVLFVCQYC